MNQLSVVLIIGTGREGNATQDAANYILHRLKQDERLDISLINVGDYENTHTVSPWGDKTDAPTYQKICADADAFVIVSPEYNHSYPGELKLFLDSMYPEYEHKPFGVCGVSSGPFGGARMVDHIKPVLIELKGVPLKTSLFFPKVSELFDKDGKMQDTDTFDPRVDQFKKDLMWYAETLKYGRKNIAL